MFDLVGAYAAYVSTWSLLRDARPLMISWAQTSQQPIQWFFLFKLVNSQRDSFVLKHTKYISLKVCQLLQNLMFLDWSNNDSQVTSHSWATGRSIKVWRYRAPLWSQCFTMCTWRRVEMKRLNWYVFCRYINMFKWEARKHHLEQRSRRQLQAHHLEGLIGNFCEPIQRASAAWRETVTAWRSVLDEKCADWYQECA